MLNILFSQDISLSRLYSMEDICLRVYFKYI